MMPAALRLQLQPQPRRRPMRLRLRPGRRLRRAPARRQCARRLYRRARPLDRRDAGPRPRDQPQRDHLHPAPRRRGRTRTRRPGPHLLTTAKSSSSPAIPRSAPPAGSISNHPVSARRREITLDLARRPHPCPLHSTAGQRARRLRHHAAERSHLRRDPRSAGRPRALAAALSLSVDDLDPDLPTQTVSTGMAFCIVPLRSLEVAARLAILAAARTGLSRPHRDAKFFHCITRAAADSGADWHARMQFYNGEDPATGSASGCTIAYLVRHGLAASGQPIVIEQGIEMLRPSRIHVRQRSTDGSRDKCVRRRPHHSCCNADAFSCRDAPDFNRHARESPMNSRRFKITVDAQAQILLIFAHNFAVAKLANLRTVGKR